MISCDFCKQRVDLIDITGFIMEHLKPAELREVCSPCKKEILRFIARMDIELKEERNKRLGFFFTYFKK